MPWPPDLPVIPVLDLARGQVVHAVRGERARYLPVRSRRVAGSDPVEVAAALLDCVRAQAGPPRLYIADLDALQGGAPQREAIARLGALDASLELWLDAGFDRPQAAHELGRTLGSLGRRMRAVYGSESLADAAALAAVAGDPRAILSLDCRAGRPLDRAGCWTHEGQWPGTVIAMSLDRVGAEAGPDLALLAALRARAPRCDWVGAGGIRGLADLEAAAAAGASAWLVASALHDGRLGPP